MRQITITYGLAGGALVVLMMAGSVMIFEQDYSTASVTRGFVAMILALTFVFVGIRRYRGLKPVPDISFLEGIWCGFGIAAVASVCYTLYWEVYLYLTDYQFMAEYTAYQLAEAKAAGLSDAQIFVLTANLEEASTNYEHFVFRTGITFMEMFPVGALISLLSAFVLKNPKFLAHKKAH